MAAMNIKLNTYTYTKHDVKGNWTERIKDKNGEQTTETRTIEYYY